MTKIIFRRNHKALTEMSFYIEIKRNIAVQIFKTVHCRFHHLTVIGFENAISHTNTTGKLNFTGLPFFRRSNILFIHTKIRNGGTQTPSDFDPNFNTIIQTEIIIQ